MYANQLEQLLSSVSEKEGFDAHQRFLQICFLAKMSFPAGTLSKEEIEQNPSTLPLMNFLLTAFRGYYMRTDKEKPSSTVERRTLLAHCFGLDAGKHGGNRRARAWDELHEQRLLNTFTRAFEEKSDLKSWKSAFVKTYELAFGDDLKGGGEDRQRRKNRNQLDRLLAQHGFGAKTFQVNLNELAK